MFDIRYSLFKSFFYDQTGCPLARGSAIVKLHRKEGFRCQDTTSQLPVTGHLIWRQIAEAQGGPTCPPK
ncbi:hypothetical protein D1AOALGA4SA_3309 [Olavius algarvensis Delta 1 endosymbiont]|nr:hypothetical protein D1AOALGA4SA_3309 [Olavius algarvensis Delta 1 endosymbiont]